eukprot:3319064-Rhodomonas_salina.1
MMPEAPARYARRQHAWYTIRRRFCSKRHTSACLVNYTVAYAWYNSSISLVRDTVVSAWYAVR